MTTRKRATPVAEKTPAEAADTRPFRSTVLVSRADVVDLRALALRLGCVQTTTAAAGKDGSLSALLRLLAAHYRADPESLSTLLAWRLGRMNERP